MLHKIVPVVRLLLIALLLPMGAAKQTTAQNNPIRVGSKWFPENAILGSLIIVALEDAGYPVSDRTNLGNTATNRTALRTGEIDVYPEYTGTALHNFYTELDWVTIADDVPGDAYLSYTTVSTLDAAIHDLIWLRPAPANNTFALVVTRAFSEANGITSMADFAAYANDGEQVLLATSEEFAQRPDGLPAFQQTYGFDLRGEQMLVIVDVTPAEAEQALLEGVNGINVAMAYSTDGALLAYDLVALSDDQHAQPVYQPAPVFRGEILRAYPEIVGIINPIFATLDTETLQRLNAEVEIDGRTPREVAETYLQETGFVSPG